MKAKIIVHCLVKNEERFIWYSLMSVLPFVDLILVWDTGSTDSTVNIIKSIDSQKISFKEYGSVTAESYPQARQNMLAATPHGFTWLLILDGDEIWPKNSIRTLVKFAQDNDRLESVVVRTENLIGDIYHRLPESVGQYHLAGRTGHLALRLLNLKSIPGLNARLPHGQIGYFDAEGKLVQNRNADKIAFLPIHYAHATHLHRSRADKMTLKRAFKYKYDLGVKIPRQDIPEIFFTPERPKFVFPVTSAAPLTFWLIGFMLRPLKMAKRLFQPGKSGY